MTMKARKIRIPFIRTLCVKPPRQKSPPISLQEFDGLTKRIYIFVRQNPILLHQGAGDSDGEEWW
jgi:hypothetical protein